MNYLSADKLSKSYADLVLFENISFGLDKGEKTALIANNGTGKSTLFKIISNLETADTGTVTFRDGISIGYLEQEPVFDEELSIIEMVRSGHSAIYQVINNYQIALEENSREQNSITQRAFELASNEMDFLHAWDFERRVKQYFTLFNVYLPDQLIGTLSGGQKKRLALALVLIDEPDILLLDEPTNHLDIEMIEWLEKYLQKTTAALLMVTHDRYFLDRVCNHIFELDEGRLYQHKGNYSYFLDKKKERLFNQDTEVKKATNFVRKEVEWMRRMPKARTTKSKARIDSFYEKESIAGSGKREQEIKLDIQARRIGGNILELQKVNKGYGSIRILENFNYLFKRGDRIGIVGKNGSGKSSFLNLITGQESVDSGIISKGETIVFGYYSQAGIQFQEDKRVIDVVTEIAEVIEIGKGRTLTASQFLNFFLFPPKRQHDYVSKLSGGEKKRLYLLTVLIKNPNFLILDEPTNDLDLTTLNKLEEFLAAFKGCVLIVSHDRYFLDNLADHLFVFKGDAQIVNHPGNYTSYREKLSRLEQSKKREKPVEEDDIKPSDLPKKPVVKTKRNYKENQEFNRLEGEIEILELEKQKLEGKLNSEENDYESLQKDAERIGEIISIIDEKTLRWMELDELS